jgi:transcriptional regulator with XRE-family HTH domain
VDVKTEIREFLTSRRANVTPEQAGVVSYGARRVPGLRRSEVAALAGVSVEYYTRIERGNLSGVSDAILEALARALHLDDAERAHLLDLARAARPATAPRRPRRSKPKVRPNVQWVLDAFTGGAAFVTDRRQDVVAANRLGEALWSPLYALPRRPVNASRSIFLDPVAAELFPDASRMADETAALLRTMAGEDPHDPGLAELVGELSMHSQEFRRRWAAHDVRFHHAGSKRVRHPAVGELTLNFDRFDIAADSGLTMFTYTAEPGTRSAEGLSLLASWAAIPDALPTERQAIEADHDG